MRAIQKTGDDTYISSSLWFYALAWVFFVAIGIFIMLLMLTIGLVVYLIGAGVACIRGRKQLKAWNRRYARFLRWFSDTEDEEDDDETHILPPDERPVVIV
jgi:hypothetical protein